MSIDRRDRRRALLLVPLAAFLAAPSGVGAQEQGGARVSDNRRVVVDDAEETPVRGLDIPGLAADPGDADHLVLTAEDLLAGECTYRVTFDRGDSWAGGTLEAPEGFPEPPCTGFDSGGYTHMDGSVAFGSGQHVYTTFSSRREGEGDSVLVARSTDGGRTFETATVAIPGGTERSAEGDVGPVLQRPKLAVEAGAEGDRVYVAAWGGAYLDVEDVPGCGGPCGYRVVTAVSDDGGQTWAEPVDATAPRTPEELVATAPLDIAREQSQPVVAPDGDVFVAWRARFDTETGEDRLGLATSTDGGATWEQSVVGGDDELISGLSHPKMAAGPEGTLYVTYGADGSAEDDADRDIFLRRSTDGGETWSDAMRVNDDELANGVDQSVPQVEASPEGRVDVVWHDRRHAYPGPAESNDIYYAFSQDQGQSFSPNHRVTDRTINLDVGLDARVGTTSFYHPAVAALGDGSAMVAWADPRRGNFLDGSQDIYVATVDLAFDGPPPVEALEATTPTGDLAMSQLAYPGGNQRVDGEAGTKVVIVAEDDVAAALAAAPLARANYGPILVSSSSGLGDLVEDEIVRLAPKGAFVIGGEEALAPDVIADLVDAGLAEDAIVRLEGADDAALAASVARALADTPLLTTDDLADHQEEGTPVPTIDGAVLVNPEDGAAPFAAALAAARRLPVLFTTPDDVPPATAEALASLPVERTLVVGGAASISEEAMASLPSPTRIEGDAVAAAATAVAEEAAARGLPTNMVYLADPDQPMAATVMGASVARLGGLMLAGDGAGGDGPSAAIDGVEVAAGADRIVTVETATEGRNWLPLVLAVAFVAAGALFAVLALRRARAAG